MLGRRLVGGKGVEGEGFGGEDLREEGLRESVGKKVRKKCYEGKGRYKSVGLME